MEENRIALRELGIEVDKIRGISGKLTCPQCSHSRKKKTDPCLSVNIQEGIYKCHNCQWSGGVYKKEYHYEPKKTYVRPSFVNTTECSEKTVNWFFKRGISQKTLNKARVTESQEWMPGCQPGQKVTAINFNYFRDGELINTKFRDGKKNFKLSKNAELIFYGLDNIKNTKTAIITEGECFTGDAEVLTKNGWVKLVDYSDQEVLQIDGCMNGHFVQPIAKLEKHYNGELIKLHNNQRFYSLTTPNHNIVVVNNKTNSISKCRAKDIKTGYSIPRVVNIDCDGIDLTDDELRLCVVISADFTIRDDGSVYGAFKKKRKVERIEKLFNKCGVDYSLNIDGRGYYSVFIRKNNSKSEWFKLFPKHWYGNLSLNQRKVIIDEILYWDGNDIPDRNQIEYSSKELHNAEFIQLISHSIGFSSTIMKRKNKYGEWYKVSILFNKKNTDTQSLIRKKEFVYHNGPVFCLTVPSGMLLIRQNGCISVSGNCDYLSFLEANVSEVVSVPNGASISNNPNLEYLDSSIDYFSNKDKIILATDNDEAGIKLRDELVRRLGVHRCYKVDFKDCKDGNEYLQKYGADALREAVSDKNIQPFPISGVVDIDGAFSEMDYILKNGGLKRALTIGIEAIDKLISWDKPQLTVVTGIPNHGKSPMVLQIQILLSIKYGWKWGMFTPEHYPLGSFLIKIVEMISGKMSRTGRITNNEKELARQFIKDHFFFIRPEKGSRLDSIIEIAKSLVFRHGITGLVMDPWNKLEYEQPSGMSETNFVSQQLDKIIEFNQECGVHTIIVAHPTKAKKSGLSENSKFVVPELSDIAGSANWHNKVDNGIVFYRDFIENVNRFYVKKVKFEHLGSQGVATLKYNVNNSRFSSLSAPHDNSNWLIPDAKQNDLFEESAPEGFFESKEDLVEEEVPF